MASLFCDSGALMYAYEHLCMCVRVRACLKACILAFIFIRSHAVFRVAYVSSY